MKCQYCNGTGEHINDANRMTTCEFCGGTGICELGSPCPHQESLTKEEYIRSCSTEELATVIYGIAMYDMLYDRIHNAFVLNPCEDDSAGINEVIKWLKEKHDEML